MLGDRANTLPMRPSASNSPSRFARRACRRAAPPAVFGWSGANIAPKVESTTSNEASSNGSSWASPSTNSISSPSAAARSRPFSRARDVVHPHGLAEPPGRGERGVAAPAGDVEDPLAGKHLHRLAELLADDLRPVADLGEVPRRPHLLLDLGDRAKVGCGVSHRTCTISRSSPAADPQGNGQEADSQRRQVGSSLARDRGRRRRRFARRRARDGEHAARPAPLQDGPRREASSPSGLPRREDRPPPVARHPLDGAPLRHLHHRRVLDRPRPRAERRAPDRPRDRHRPQQGGGRHLERDRRPRPPGRAAQDAPIPPWRWVGWNGDPGHGRGNHLHLSWMHSPAKPGIRPGSSTRASARRSPDTAPARHRQRSR